MTKNSTSQKLSRRDAIKLLGAAVGASVLASLPSKWSTPELASGVLPAHAQTSGILHTLLCNADEAVGEPDSNQYLSGVTINPPDAGIVMRWNIALNNVTLDNPGDPITGTAVTNGLGQTAFATPPVTIVNPALSASVTVTWSFENDPLDGSGSCDQVFAYQIIL